MTNAGVIYGPAAGVRSDAEKGSDQGPTRVARLYLTCRSIRGIGLIIRTAPNDRILG